MDYMLYIYVSFRRGLWLICTIFYTTIFATFSSPYAAIVLNHYQIVNRFLKCKGYKDKNLYLTDVIYVHVKRVPDFSKLLLIKSFKIKNFQGSMPPNHPSFPHDLHANIYLPTPPLPPIIHTSHLAPHPLWEKNLKETLSGMMHVHLKRRKG